MGRLASRIHGLAHDRNGGVAIMFAMAIPVLAVIAIGAIEIAHVTSEKSHMQAIADAAALSAAAEAVVAPVGAAERAKAYATEALLVIKAPTTTAVTAVAGEDGSLRVAIDAHRPSLLANLLPPGGWKYKAEAVAHAMNRAPLCVLASGKSGSKVINLLDTSRIEAGQCLIHSNENVEVEGSSSIQAALVQAAGLARGFITPAAEANAETLDDPFASMSTKTSASCTDNGIMVGMGKSETLAAGVHCGKVMVGKSASLTLGPGEHYFRKAELQIVHDGKLLGSDVVIFFDKDSKLKWQDDAYVSLEGRRTGAYTGFLLITDRDHTNDVDIWSDSVDTLLGVVYTPNAKIVVDGKKEVAEASDWTVVVAKEVQLKGSSTLTINTNYAASEVKVPVGVGPNGAAVRLSR